MKRLVLGLLLVGASAQAAEHKYTVGVFLPTSIADGQARFEFAEALAKALSGPLGQPVSGKSFAKFEDFTKAAGDGTLDLAVVDAWALAQGNLKGEPVALGSIAGQTHRRWVVVARSGNFVKELNGQKLAVPKGAAGQEAKFATNVVFAGDYQANKGFKLVPVPAIDSAIKAVESKSAAAALIPQGELPKDFKVIYRSPRIPGAVALSLHGDAAAVRSALLSSGGAAPITKFVEVKAQELDDLKVLFTKGPPKRIPAVAESPTLRPPVEPLVDMKKVGYVLPDFLEQFDSPSEKPDD